MNERERRERELEFDNTEKPFLQRYSEGMRTFSPHKRVNEMKISQLFTLHGVVKL